MTRDQDIQTTTRQLYDVRALYEGLADALAELGPKPLREPDVMIVGARCPSCGITAGSILSQMTGWTSFPVRVSAEKARRASEKIVCRECGAIGTLLALEPVPEHAP